MEEFSYLNIAEWMHSVNYLFFQLNYNKINLFLNLFKIKKYNHSFNAKRAIIRRVKPIIWIELESRLYIKLTKTKNK